MKHKLLTSDAKLTGYTLAEAEQMLPLINAIAAEIGARNEARRALLSERNKLDQAKTPEGLGSAIADLEAQVWPHTEGLRAAIEELTELGLTLLRQKPVTIHIPGQTVGGPVVFCWQEGDSSIDHGHPIGEEDDPRRPLRVRAPEGFRSS